MKRLATSTGFDELHEARGVDSRTRGSAHDVVGTLIVV